MPSPEHRGPSATRNTSGAAPGPSAAAPLAAVTAEAVAKIAAEDEQRRGDARFALRRVLLTLGVAAVAAGAIEGEGLNIAARHGGRELPTNLKAMLLVTGGLVNLLLAKSGGILAGILVLPFRRKLARPLRTLAHAFAVGTGAVLALLAALTLWAP